MNTQATWTEWFVRDDEVVDPLLQCTGSGINTSRAVGPLLSVHVL